MEKCFIHYQFLVFRIMSDIDGPGEALETVKRQRGPLEGRLRRLRHL
jgi:hypothetical protein